MLEVHIEANDAGQRLDRFLSKSFPNLKKSAMHKGIREKKIKVNRKRAAPDQKLQQGDVLLLFLKPELLERQARTIAALPDPDIVYEDESIIAMNKPAGLLSMKDEAGDQDTLNGRLLSYLCRTGQYDPGAEQSFTPSIAHRLDRNTSGLVLAGKTAQAVRDLAQAIRDHRLEKTYLCITDRRPPQGRLTMYLKKDGTRARVRAHAKEGYDPAVMSVTTLQEKDGKFLSRVSLETGRFHQIRAVLAALGAPLCGDVKYGGTKNSTGYALQAYRVDTRNTPFDKAGVIELPSSQKLHL